MISDQLVGGSEWTVAEAVGIRPDLPVSDDPVDDQLVAAILTHRAAEAELAEQRRASEKSEDTRTILAQQALPLSLAHEPPEDARVDDRTATAAGDVGLQRQ